MKPASTQQDRNMNFDGMESIAPKGSTKYQTNAWSGHMNDGRLVNKGRGPTVGNQDHAAMKVGPAVTKDAYRAAPTSALPASTKIKNPDYINGGAQVRTPGGTRDWMPSKTQNYDGNPDAIRARQTGGPGYGATSKSRTPNTARGESNFNYGPKSQY